MASWGYFLVFTLLCIMVQGFFSMFEMAAVSFNKVRLQYYITKKSKLAIWLSSLLNRPSRLFGTTLILIDTALQFGSEFSRRFYESVGLNPDFAPISQIFLVLIFAELAPMFAARKYPEHVAFCYIPLVYFISKLFTPILYLLDKLNTFLHRLFGKSAEVALFLSREEIQKAFEEKEESIDSTVTRFFSLKHKMASEMSLPLSACPLLPSNSDLRAMKELLKQNYSSFVALYHQDPSNIVGIVYSRDLLRQDDSRKLIDFTKPAWFITQKTYAIDILMQFRRNHQSTAVVLGPNGKAEGILTLDTLIDALFGESEDSFLSENIKAVHFEKTISASMPIEEFNARFHMKIKGGKTVNDYIKKQLGHHPAKGEKLVVDHLEIEIKESAFFGAKTLSIRSL